MSTIIQRDDLVSIKQFCKMLEVDPRTLARLIRHHNIDGERILDGTTERVYINLDRFLSRAKDANLSPVGYFKTLARQSRR